MEEEESEPLPLSITLSITAVRPGAARGGQGSLHVWEAGWQERHGGERVGLNGVREREREREEQVSVCAAQYVGKLRVQRRLFVCTLFIRAHPCVLETVSVFACMNMRTSTHS